jgi:hypothetical protein
LGNKKEEILSNDLLKLKIKGGFGFKLFQ